MPVARKDARKILGAKATPVPARTVDIGKAVLLREAPRAVHATGLARQLCIRRQRDDRAPHETWRLRTAPTELLRLLLVQRIAPVRLGHAEHVQRRLRAQE